jgi:predicted GNAT family acetyltransferase
MYARVLQQADQPILEAFLTKHRDSSMILRSNLLAAGIEDCGARYSGVYAGAFDTSGTLRGVAAHYRLRGGLFPQAECEEALDAAVACAARCSGRQVRAVIGLRPLVRRTIALLKLDDAPCDLDQDEGLYALQLAELHKPALLFDPEVELRALEPGDMELALQWQLDYEINCLGAQDTAALRARCVQELESKLAGGLPRWLTHEGRPSAMTGFSASLPDTVQVGPVYTPPRLRGRGYARAAVALSLADARARGVKRAVLFTGDDNRPALAAYRALGFERVGDFALVLFRAAHDEALAS